MTIKKWFFMFWTTLAIGAAVSMIAGLVMLFTDQNFGFFGIELDNITYVEATGFNLLMMALSGLTIGAFSQMGFFAYLTLNYIALSVLRQKYLWNALQGYTTIFVTFGLGYILYENRTNAWFFWVMPLLLLVASLIVSYFKVKNTKRAAFIPTMFLMFVVTAIEAYPAIQGETNISAIIFMILPLFVCNAYQNHIMASLTKSKTVDSTAVAAKTTA